MTNFALKQREHWQPRHPWFRLERKRPFSRLAKTPTQDAENRWNSQV